MLFRFLLVSKSFVGCKGDGDRGREAGCTPVLSPVHGHAAQPQDYFSHLERMVENKDKSFG
jgi:hypothetical protein